MKPHDYEQLNDAQCLHVNLFSERLAFWRGRNLGDATCFRLARIDAQKRFPLEGEEVAQMDEYVATRFVRRVSAEPRREGEPTPMMVVK